jgi:hypothetical protein
MSPLTPEIVSDFILTLLTLPVMYFLPLRILFDMKHKEKLSDKMLSQCYEVYSKEMLNLHLGQALDIAWHSTLLNQQITQGIANHLV